MMVYVDKNNNKPPIWEWLIPPIKMVIWKIGFHNDDGLIRIIKLQIPLMWVKQCHKPPIWAWFMPPIKIVIWGIVYGIVLPTLVD